MQQIFTSYCAIVRLEFVFSFFLVSRAGLCLYACARRWRRWRARGGGVSIACCVWSKNARATRRVGFAGASGARRRKTASRRSAQHWGWPGAFVLHEMQRTADVPIFSLNLELCSVRRRTVL